MIIFLLERAGLRIHLIHGRVGGADEVHEARGFQTSGYLFNGVGKLPPLSTMQHRTR